MAKKVFSATKPLAQYAGCQVARRAALLALLTLQLTGCLESSEDEPTATDSAPTNVSTETSGTVNNPPTISGTPPTEARVGSEYTFSPQASDPDGDTLTFSATGLPPWVSLDSSSGRLTGEPQDGDVGIAGPITITVSDGNSNDSLDPFEIDVVAISMGNVTLSWTAPTQNEDGSPLTDLAGFKLYYGSQSGIYSEIITLDNPGLSTYVVDNLTPQTWYFSAKALNASGVESDFAAEVSKLVD